MSKLSNAPLIEVIFEIRWPFMGGTARPEEQYLPGDLYPLLKDDYPFRETLQALPFELLISAPTHRFRTAQDDYPLVQVGPGILSVNTIDNKYFWETFEGSIIRVVEKLQSVYNFKGRTVNLALQYIDLIEFDFEKEDVISYLKDYLNISVNQNFYKAKSHPKNITLALNFESDLGVLGVTIARGTFPNGVSGIAIQTNLTKTEVQPDVKIIKDWLSNAHETCSTSFKEMTKGKLYDSFSNPK